VKTTSFATDRLACPGVGRSPIVVDAVNFAMSAGGASPMMHHETVSMMQNV
jgi:hypothetical protein